jgi:hypothetical protein
MGESSQLASLPVLIEIKTGGTAILKQRTSVSQIDHSNYFFSCPRMPSSHACGVPVGNRGSGRSWRN